MAKILVVDDQATNRELLVTLLAYQGHTLFEAEDGMKALELARREHPDLVITDILMPSIDGYEFVRRLREDEAVSHTQVIFYTATYIENEARSLAEACGVKHILVKPVEPQAVFSAVADALDENVGRSPAPPEKEFGQEHLRLITDKLAEKIEDLEKVQYRLEQEIIQRRQAEEALRLSEEYYRLLFEKNPQAMWVYDLETLCFLAVNDTAVRKYGFEQGEFLSMTIDEIRPEYAPRRARRDPAADAQAIKDAGVRVHRLKDGSLIKVEVTSQDILFNQKKARLVLANDITERLKTQEEIQIRLEELETVNRFSTDLRSAQSLEDMVPRLLEETLILLDCEEGVIYLSGERNPEFRSVYSRGWKSYPTSIAGDDPLVTGLKAVGVCVFHPGGAEFSGGLLAGATTGATLVGVAIRAAESIIGVMAITLQDAQEITQMELNLLVTLAEIAGNAIQRMRFFEQTQRRLKRINSLHEIDLSISSNAELRLTLVFLLDQALSQLDAAAADVYLLNPYSQVLEFSSAKGFQSGAENTPELRLDSSLAGQAVIERRTVQIQDIRETAPRFLYNDFLIQEGFVSYYATPLISKGMVKGVLEVFQRKPFLPDLEWLDYLDTLAGQAAIAVDNHVLFNDLQQSRMELLMAYEATIEGWSRALDLRDKETEGHTQRVTEATLLLARKLGFNEADLVHVRRGALLHDIGKMGVPDAILHKAGPLTEEEWKIMKMHPVFAYQMLSPIRYLHTALDIPYCHHEKWDGSGYPQGLKEEQIPLQARIFAVVDVWDAVSSDRPYRNAWPEEKVRDYIRLMSGTQFDPEIANVFLESPEFINHALL